MSIHHRGCGVHAFKPISDCIYLATRSLQLSILFTPLVILSLPLWRFNQQYCCQLLLLCIRLAGGTFIKLGQWAATRPDILPQSLCSALSTLQSSAPHHSTEWSKHVISQYGALGDLSIEHLVGSGTIGQVYKGRWKGKWVAVKIVHPEVIEIISRDLMLMSAAGHLLHAVPLFTHLNLPAEFNAFRSIMAEQTDLRLEGYSLARFSRNFRGYKDAHFPDLLFSSPDLLIESFEEGVPLQDFILHVHSHQLRERVAVLGIESFVKMLIWDNFVHADLHPGNMLVRAKTTNGTLITSVEEMNKYEKIHPEIVFVDTGLVTELTKKDHQNFIDLFNALVIQGSGFQAGMLIATRSQQPPIDPIAFARRISSIAAPVISARFNFGARSSSSLAIGPILTQVMDAVREHQVVLDPAYTNLVMAIVCIEGVGRQLIPNLHMQPILVNAGLQFMVTEVARTFADNAELYL